MSDPSRDVVDDAAHHRFVYAEAGHLAQLVYRDEVGRFIVVHTEVPEALGGRGIAGRLVQAAVERAKDLGATLVPWCPYARQWLESHPDAASAVTIEWGGPIA
jgi:predicted GNAT family acetyltransferase